MAIDNIFTCIQFDEKTDKFFQASCGDCNPDVVNAAVTVKIPLTTEDFDMFQVAYKKVTAPKERTLYSFGEFLKLQHQMPNNYLISKRN